MKMEIIYIRKDISKNFKCLDLGEWFDEYDLEELLVEYNETIDNYTKNKIKLVYSDPVIRDGNFNYYIFIDGIYKDSFFYEEIGYGFISQISIKEIYQRIMSQQQKFFIACELGHLEVVKKLLGDSCITFDDYIRVLTPRNCNLEIVKELTNNFSKKYLLEKINFILDIEELIFN